MGTTQESWPQGAGDADQVQRDPNHADNASDTQSGIEPALSFNEIQSACEQSGLTLDDVLTERLSRCASEAHPTSTALLLSDQCPFSTVYVRFANHSKDTIIGKSTLTGSLLHQMREAEALPGRRRHRRRLAAERRARGVDQRHAPPRLPVFRTDDHQPLPLAHRDHLPGRPGFRIEQRRPAQRNLPAAQSRTRGRIRAAGLEPELRRRHPTHHGRLCGGLGLPSAARWPGIGRRRPADHLTPASVHRRRCPERTAGTGSHRQTLRLPRHVRRDGGPHEHRRAEHRLAGRHRPLRPQARRPHWRR